MTRPSDSPHDYWPLGRFAPAEATVGSRRWTLVRLVVEKTALFALAAAIAVATFVVFRQAAGPASSFAELSFDRRVANALLAYVTYLRKTVWPMDLAAFYPYPASFPAWRVLGAVLLLAALTLIALRLARRYPYLLVGWLWYIGTLVPVIGLVHLGRHALADRYTYIPLVGLFIALTWGIGDLLARARARPLIGRSLAGAAGAACLVATQAQVDHWRNSVTLFEQALAVTTDNYTAHLHLGAALAEQGRLDESLTHYRAAVAIAPDYGPAHNDLGGALRQKATLRAPSPSTKPPCG